MGGTILIGLVIVVGVVNAVIPPEMAARPRPDDRVDTVATAGTHQPAWFNRPYPMDRGRGCVVRIAGVTRGRVRPRAPPDCADERLRTPAGTGDPIRAPNGYVVATCFEEGGDGWFAQEVL